MKNVILRKIIVQRFFRTKSTLSRLDVLEETTKNHEKKELQKLNIIQKEKLIKPGPSLKEFIQKENNVTLHSALKSDPVPYLDRNSNYGLKRKVYFEVYGCQMNVNDTEIVWSILKDNGFLKTENLLEADIVLLITCAIRDSAEVKIWKRLEYLKSLKKKKSLIEYKPFLKVGVLGCMAERLKTKLLEKDKLVDIVAGPDSYRDLPRLLALTENNQTAVNILLSLEETYADVTPIRLNQDSVSAFVSIMRGCDNMCTYCIVPFTRGRERSRPVDSILDEVRQLSEQGVKEITLLGQNVNSYRDLSKAKSFYTLNSSKLSEPVTTAKGFKTVYKTKIGGLRFADLLCRVAEINPEIRIRFTSPHPKDFPNEVLEAIKSKPNICKSLHMPAQSGNTEVLLRMRRGYTREAYLDLVNHIRSLMPSVTLSSDFICGFCGETEKEFEDTLSLMEIIKYNTAYLFSYSMREKTTAHRRYVDDVPKDVKVSRLIRMSAVYRKYAEVLNRSQIGQIQLVLVEGNSKRSEKYLAGRNDGNIKVIFPKGRIPHKDGNHPIDIKVGSYVAVQINDANSQVLKGIPLYHTTLMDFYRTELCKKHDISYLKYASYM
ncbi:CDK5RAP1-like protein [Agrilus planipennis]|uniref:CDK5RAP1-like protein n=1 Tax=Agrilus planipennis TaxID=224129 RepID=A0A1W4WR80_AGRPL|nr:CDK5RAP1-like protein [Agrilus planipennis]